MDNPEASLNILTTFGFCTSRYNSNLLIYKQPKHIPSNVLFRIYCMTHISPKLFNLACNQLYFKVLKPITVKIASVDNGILNPGSSINDTNSTRAHNNRYTAGVFLLDQHSSDIQLDTTKQLINQLLQLPSQHHCYRGFINKTDIWILNNNGKEYENIDWKKMDLYKLINNLPSDFHKSISNCIQFCVDNNQITFLKKVFYFLTKYHKDICCFWTTTPQLTMIHARRHAKIIGNHGFFIEQIKQLCSRQYAICRNNGTLGSFLTTLSNQVDKLVNDEIIPALKLHSHLYSSKHNKDLLKQKKFWTCFICKTNNSIDIYQCQTCLNNQSLYRIKINGIHQFLKNPIITSINPYTTFIKNDSSLFNIDKPFGILKHHRLARKINYADFKCQNDKTIISVICDRRYDRISILFSSNNSLTIYQLKILVYEWWAYTQGCGKYREMVDFSFNFHRAVFSGLSNNDLIPQTKDMKPYYIDISQEKMEMHTRICKKYKIQFGKKHCNFQCPFMIVAMKKLENQKSKLNPFIHCPYFSDEHDNGDRDLVMQHLSSYDHFDSFNIVQSVCCLQNNCPFFQNVSNRDNHDENFNYKKHLYLYRHTNNNSSKIMTKNMFKKNFKSEMV